MKEIICLTPYRELRHGADSLKAHLSAPRILPERVRQYLSLGRVVQVVQGIYRHPFSGKELVGPVLLGDGGRYTWDRDTLEYVEKYGLELPDEFIDYVMGSEGFLRFCRLRRMA